MCYLTTVVGSFHGRVLAARLGAEGVIVVLKGTTDGPYPIQSTVDVLVPADQLKLAREILLADAVDDAFGDMALDDVSNPDPARDSSGSGETWDEPRAGLIPVSSGPSDNFTLRAQQADDGSRRTRLSGLVAVLVLVVVATMIVAGGIAIIVH
jgi:hypothetical protein